jgi:hypothetical protein
MADDETIYISDEEASVCYSLSFRFSVPTFTCLFIILDFNRRLPLESYVTNESIRLADILT